jgi:GTPase SAR1 family protein
MSKETKVKMVVLGGGGVGKSCITLVIYINKKKAIHSK